MNEQPYEAVATQ